MMESHKMIIHNFTTMNDLEALQHIATVVHEGEISETPNGKQYCFATSFKDGSVVETTKKGNTYTFRLYANQQLD